MNNYLLRDKEIWLYGAGSVGKVLSEALQRNGGKIAGFIDKRAEVIKSFEGKPVRTIEDMGKLEEKSAYCIIITIRNVFEHSRLALLFYTMGFNHIIFKPISILKGRAEDAIEAVNQAYEDITGKLLFPEYPISIYVQEEIFCIEDNGFIREAENGFVIVRIPTELLFSNQIKNSVWSCQNFLSNYIAVDLYKVFNGDFPDDFEKKIKRYIEEFAIDGARKLGVNTSGEWADILIDSRLAVYYEMDSKLLVDAGFFVENCTTVGQRENGGFQLIASGKNRVSFLTAKQFRYIPVKIEKESYKYYLNEKAAYRVADYLKENHIMQLSVPIPHPFFYEYDCMAPGYVYECIQKISHFLANQVFDTKKAYTFHEYRIAVGLDDNGTMSRFLKMLGFEVERIYNREEKLIMLLDSLFYMSQDQFEPGNKHYFACVIHSGMNQKQQEDILSRTEKYCFFIHFGVDGAETVSLKTDFSVNKTFMCTIWNKKKVKGLIYERR